MSFSRHFLGKNSCVYQCCAALVDGGAFNIKDFTGVKKTGNLSYLLFGQVMEVKADDHVPVCAVGPVRYPVYLSMFVWDLPAVYKTREHQTLTMTLWMIRRPDCSSMKDQTFVSRSQPV
ncbi:hypothetical protein Bbelb_162160 [Branchiostoma belcheri]|nr:hypothetical protein Bbelb_162160 [Branchiostoma belcheri]